MATLAAVFGELEAARRSAPLGLPETTCRAAAQTVQAVRDPMFTCGVANPGHLSK